MYDYPYHFDSPVTSHYCSNPLTLSSVAANAFGNSMLLRGADEGSLMTMRQALTGYGADINTYEIGGSDSADTPLHKAAYRGHWPAVEFLISRGANPAVRNAMGSMPLFYAVKPTITRHRDRQEEEADTLRTVEFLIPRSGDINNANRDGETALHAAADRGPASVITTLIRAGANVNARDRWNYTPLRRAFSQGRDPEVIRLLIENGAVLGQEELQEQAKRQMLELGWQADAQRRHL